MVAGKGGKRGLGGGRGGGGRGKRGKGGKGWWYLASSAKPALTKKGVLTVF